jgi:RNA polymerase sigma-70 factor (ECF subfamily)
MITSYEAIGENLYRYNEPDLIRIAQTGDTQAFNQLVLGYQDRIFTLAVRILGDVDTADDVTQNTFLTAYLNLPRFRNGSFSSWLFRIATNLCYDEYRQHKRHPVLSIENEMLSEEIIFPLDNFSSSNLLPEAEFDKRELRQTIQQALNQLDTDHRSVVVLVDQLDLDYKETAQILRIPIGTVKSRLARARMRLKQLLGTVHNF